MEVKFESGVRRPVEVVAKPKIVVQYTERAHDSGASSAVYWNHPDLLAALRVAFRMADSERLMGLEVSEDGIRAFITRAPSP